MGLFYENRRLKMGAAPEEAFDLTEIAQRGTPFYAYDLSGMEREIKKLKTAFGALDTHIHFAVKANSHAKILSHFAKLGLGADVVSAGEARLARTCGFKAEDIIFSGVAKTKADIEYALDEGIGQLNVESPQELERIAGIAGKLKKQAPIAFRLNPDVNPETHPYITTGFRENKFGMDESFLPELIELLKKNETHLKLQGVAIHIGSQLRNNASFKEAIEKTLPIFFQLKELGWPVKSFDIGGGVGIDYQQGRVDDEQVKDYGRMVQTLLSPTKAHVICEPGRLIAACHGVLVGEVQYVKKTPYKEFLILNTGMHHLVRPALYQAYHRLLPLNENTNPKKQYDVVGPICESTDFLAKNRELPEMKSGDFLAICEAGAYGRSMASGYNAHEYPQEYVFYRGKLV